VSGILLDHGLSGAQSYSLLRSLPSGMTGWLHFHFYVTTNVAYPFNGGVWQNFATEGSRVTAPSVNEAITISPTEACYMFKMQVPVGSGETGIIWDGGAITGGSFIVSNFYFGFTQIESEADEKLAAFKKTVKDKIPKKWIQL